MISLVVMVALFAALAALAFLTKRKFGVLGLGLAAGSLLSTNWSSTLTPWFEQQGITLAAPPLSSVVAAGLVLAPALFLLLGGPVYTKVGPRLMGSVSFALLAIAFLMAPLGVALNLDGAGQDVYNMISQYQSGIVVIGLIAAVVDVVLTRSRKDKDKDKKK